MFWDFLIFSSVFLGFCFGGDLSVLQIIIAIFVDLLLIYFMYKIIDSFDDPEDIEDEKK